MAGSHSAHSVRSRRGRQPAGGSAPAPSDPESASATAALERSFVAEGYRPTAGAHGQQLGHAVHGVGHEGHVAGCRLHEDLRQPLLRTRQHNEVGAPEGVGHRRQEPEQDDLHRVATTGARSRSASRSPRSGPSPAMSSDTRPRSAAARSCPAADPRPSWRPAGRRNRPLWTPDRPPTPHAGRCAPRNRRARTDSGRGSSGRPRGGASRFRWRPTPPPGRDRRRSSG